MSSDLLVSMLQTLDAPQHRYAELDRYFAGHQALAFLSPEARQALGDRLSRMVSNIPRLAVNSLAERLRIQGFEGADIWDDWLRNNLDQESHTAHREALALGSSYVIVWGATGKPVVSIESARTTAVLADPGTRETTAAVKRWHDSRNTYAVLYLPDRIERWQANTAGAATTAFRLVQVLDNPLGVVPVVQLRNTERIPVGGQSYPDRLLEYGHSEISDLIPLVDGVNKILADMMVAAEYTARPRRWATGIELVSKPKLDDNGQPVLDGDGNPVMEAVNPIPEGDRAMIGESEQAKFGQLPGADLSGYENAANVLLGQIMAVSALPAHYIGVMHDNPASADAIRSAEASLTARAEARQAVFGRAWEKVGQLMVAVRDNVDPASVNIRVSWNDPSTRSVGQEADAVLKLVTAGVLSRSGALRQLGYTEDQIQQELADRAADQLAGADPALMTFSKMQHDNGNLSYSGGN